ncbi:MAG: hypothetical protein ABW278_16615 [Steroidobacteraceae bacterium]
MEGGKGGNSYWPGFVDALTNVVIAMIFVIVVLAISLSFAAQLMAKKLAAEMIAQGQGTAQGAAIDAGSPVPESRLERHTRIAVAGPATDQSVAGGRLRPPRNILQLDFAANAVALDEAAATALRAELANSPHGGRVVILATGPGMGITANQRAAYLRVLAVREVLLAQGYAAAQLDMRIDTEAEASAPTVNISFEGQP